MDEPYFQITSPHREYTIKAFQGDDEIIVTHHLLGEENCFYHSHHVFVGEKEVKKWINEFVKEKRFAFAVHTDTAKFVGGGQTSVEDLEKLCKDFSSGTDDFFKKFTTLEIISWTGTKDKTLLK